MPTPYARILAVAATVALILACGGRGLANVAGQNRWVTVGVQRPSEGVWLYDVRAEPGTELTKIELVTAQDASGCVYRANQGWKVVVNDTLTLSAVQPEESSTFTVYCDKDEEVTFLHVWNREGTEATFPLAGPGHP